MRRTDIRTQTWAKEPNAVPFKLLLALYSGYGSEAIRPPRGELVMATEIIDGTVQDAKVRQSSATHTLYESIVFTCDDGSERRLDKVAVAPAVAAMLQSGAQGRFYAYTMIDHNGLVAVRTRDGQNAYAIPSGNEKLMMIAAIVGGAWFAIRLAMGGIAFLSLLVAIVGCASWLIYRRTRIDIRTRYDTDSEYANR